MLQKKDGDVPESETVAPEERAYEDNWYRSLKALAELRQDDEAESEGTEPSASDPVDAATGEPAQEQLADAEPVASEPVASEPVASEPVASEPVAAEPTSDRERLVSEEFETRAGQLLERLRSIQHLGER